MKKYLIIIVCVFVVAISLTGNSFATSIAESEGTITVDWGQGGRVFLWEDPYHVYASNGADANNDLNTPGISDYPGPGHVSSEADATASAEAAYGSAVIGQASTTPTSV